MPPDHTDSPVGGHVSPDTPRSDVGTFLVFDPPHEPDLKLVKRLIAVPGDTVSMKDGQLTLNGQLQSEPYVKHENPLGDDPDSRMEWQAEHLIDGIPTEAYRPTRDNWGPLVIPEDRYFMLGDNRDTSARFPLLGTARGLAARGASLVHILLLQQGLIQAVSVAS